MTWVERSLLAAHVLSAAGLFGALVYRAFFVDPKSQTFFREAGDYERFALHQANGMRWVVILGLSVCGLSGFGLMGLRADQMDLSLMFGKALVWLLACAVFVYISWVYLPARVFAVPTEYARQRRVGLLLALSMTGLTTIGLVLGVACRG